MGDKRKDIELVFVDDSKANIDGTTAQLWYVISRNELMYNKKVKKVDVKQKVRAIESGIVIDHIHLEYGEKIHELLKDRIPKGTSRLLLEDVESTKLGRKDLIKIYSYEISDKDVKDIYSLFEHGVEKPTISYIREWDVYKKLKPIY